MIHACWLSGDPVKEPYISCLDTWPGPLKIWSRDEVPSHPFFDTAIKLERWSKAADYFRWWVLATHGGTYFDMDIELIAPFAISGNFLPRLSLGGAVDHYVAQFERPGHPFTVEMLKNFDRLNPFQPLAESSVAMVTRALRSRGMQGYYDRCVGDIQLLDLRAQRDLFKHHFNSTGHVQEFS